MPDNQDPQTISLEAVASGGGPVVSQINLAVKTVAQRREDARQSVALLIVGSLFLIVAASFFLTWWRAGYTHADVLAVIEKLISPVVGIVGAVTGFYFGERKAGDEQRPAAESE